MAVSADWQTGKALKDRLYYMLQHQLMCDVTFLVGSDETPLKAHKLMMASASPVFYSMFNGPMAEQDAVKIPDIEKDIFNDILKFVYTGDIEINGDNVSGLLYGSEKYMLHGIKKKCNPYLRSHVDDEHACAVLQAAYDFHVGDIQNETLSYIFRHGSSCLCSCTFLSLSPESLKLIIESDDLICNEEDVYLRTIDWAKHKCEEKKLTITDKEIRSELGNLLYLIRFPIIKRKFFTQNIAKSELLTPDEKIDIFCSYDDEPVDSFSNKPGQQQITLSDDIAVRRCEINTTGSWDQGGQCDCIGFQTNIDCFMAGILVFGSKSYSGDYDITLELLKSSVVLNSTKQTLISVSGKQIYPLKFENPSKILQNTTYTIRLIMKGEQVFSGQNYKTQIHPHDTPALSVSILPPSVTSDNSTNESRGQIPGIILQIEKRKDN